MISSPGCLCLTKGASGPMSTRFWMTSRPGTLRSCCWRSVRVIPGACCTVRAMSTSSVSRRLRVRVDCRSAQRPECRPDLCREQLGLFPSGEVAAPADLVVVVEGGVGLLDPAARGPEDLAGERG